MVYRLILLYIFNNYLFNYSLNSSIYKLIYKFIKVKVAKSLFTKLVNYLIF
jgi:hypothetical protein